MTAPVRFCDLSRRTRDVGEELREALLRVVASQECILGPEVARFEAEVAESLGVAEAVGVSSGTDALGLALAAAGIGAGDEVVTTPFTFVATAEAIVRAGATPRFADVRPGTPHLDVERVAALVGPRTKAILPVHLYGLPGELEQLCTLAERHGVPVIEDAAQAFGTRLRGRALGTWGALGCFSFFPTKVLGAMGDGGLVATGAAELAAHVRSLRQHGLAGDGRHVVVGGNHRLDALQAAVLSVFLRALPASLRRRRAVAATYDAGIGRHEGVDPVPIPADVSWNAASYTVRVRDGRRDALRAHLRDLGVATRIYYAVPLHLEPAFAHLGHGPGAFPEAERAATEVLSLPLHAGLDDAEVERVVAGIDSFYR